jgi:hypothetical protein
VSEIVKFQCPDSSSTAHHFTQASRSSDSRPTEAVKFEYLAVRPSRTPERSRGSEGKRRSAEPSNLSVGATAMRGASGA